MKYCSHCGRAYCADCGREWYEYQWTYSYPYYDVTPQIYKIGNPTCTTTTTGGETTSSTVIYSSNGLAHCDHKEA